jgi:hypothetical protein
MPLWTGLTSTYTVNADYDGVIPDAIELGYQIQGWKHAKVRRRLGKNELKISHGVKEEGNRGGHCSEKLN